ncbi:hypothetical protein Bbelb_214230 [Branchiostoma belcheri]|nr:hypothetical protein Bbelb_214230 [Branchiostoma belcheri]
MVSINVVQPHVFVHANAYDAEADVSVLIGGMAVMTCPVDDVNAYRVTWTKGNSLLVEIPQVGTPLINPTVSGRVSVNGSDVIIQGVGLPDEGSYTCSVLDTSFTTEISTVDLLVRVQPQTPVITISGSPAAGQLQPGTNVTLVCHSWSGRPAAQLTWYRDGQGVNGTYLAVHDPDGFGNATVTVPLAVTEADDGVVYECVASGPAPVLTQTATVTLDVATAPVVAKTTVPSHVDSPGMTTDLPAGGVSALAGTRAVLSCDVGDVPVAKITWENDRGLVAEETTGSAALIPPVLRDRVQVNGSDVIMDPVLVSDEGQYSCTVLHRDTFEQLTDTVDLLVRAKLTCSIGYVPKVMVMKKVIVQPQAPVITISGSLAAGQLQPGTNVTLVCHSWSGRPEAQLTWYRDGHPVNDDGVTYECVTSGPPPVVTDRVEVTLGVLLPTTTTGQSLSPSSSDNNRNYNERNYNYRSYSDLNKTNYDTEQRQSCYSTISHWDGPNNRKRRPNRRVTHDAHAPGGGVVEAQSGDPILTEPQIILVVIGTAMLLVILVASVVAVQKGCFRSKWEANLTTGSASQSVGSSYRANILYANAGNGYDGPASEMEMKNKELIKPPPEKII